MIFTYVFMLQFINRYHNFVCYVSNDNLSSESFDTRINLKHRFVVKMRREKENHECKKKPMKTQRKNNISSTFHITILICQFSENIAA